MGWSLGYDHRWRRDIGYGVPAFCDHPRCDEVIDRGLSYVCCDEEPHGGEHGCGLYFCPEHQRYRNRCIRCANYSPKGPYTPKPDHPDWVRWKLTDDSWAEWRGRNPAEVERLTAALRSWDQQNGGKDGG